MKRTKGELEAQISESINKFEKEYMGRGPSEIKTYIINDMVFVRLKGVLTPAEDQLSKSPEGADLIKKTRMQLMDSARVLLEKMVRNLTGSQVSSLHNDISSRTGESIIVFILEKNLEKDFV